MILFGVHPYGLVDRIPGECHVCTTFAHLIFFPIVPVESFLIVEGTKREPDRAYPIKKSMKSVLFGVVRGFLVFLFLLLASGPLDEIVSNKPLNHKARVIGLAGLGVLAVFIATYPLSRPVAARRAYLLKLVEVARRREISEEDSEATEETRDRSSKEESESDEPPWRRGRSDRG